MLEGATLRLEATKEVANYRTPWSLGGTSISSATVTVLQYAGEIYLVTNAHAVLDATYLKIKFDQKATEIPVESIWVDPILDVAIVRPSTQKDIDFIKKELSPLELITQFQEQKTEVYAYGYAAGGTGLSYTKGNVSRVQLHQVALSHEHSIMVQTSAAINPGNSGGPITCLIDGKEKCIGLVAQGATSLQNTGYFIPGSTVEGVIKRYRKHRDLKEAGIVHYVTAPQVDFIWQSLKNTTQREEFGLPSDPLDPNLTGILVDSVPKKSCAYGFLKDEDIVHKIDGIPVQSNGHIKVPELDYPISFKYLILKKELNQEITFTIQRKISEEATTLEMMEIKIPLTHQVGQRISSPSYNKPLKYHVQPSGEKGAFVFTRYTSAYQAAFFNTTTPNVPTCFSRLNNLTQDDCSEIVILHQIINSKDTDGYENFQISAGAACLSDRVTEVNGKPINCLYDLASFLEENPEKTSKVKFANGRLLHIKPATKETKDTLVIFPRIPGHLV